MASVINTNNASLVAQRNLATSQTDLTTSVQRLSSGLRINSAKDDAAGLGISQKLQSQITGANVAARNANDAISMVSTAEGGMQEVSSMLQRMRELATQGNNDSLDDVQRGYIQAELAALRDEIGQVATRTTFNDTNLLNGDLSSTSSTSTTQGTATYHVAAQTATSGTAVIDDATTTLAIGDVIKYSIDGAADVSYELTTATIDEVVTELNADSTFAAGATASKDVEGRLVLTSNSTGSTSTLTASYVDKSEFTTTAATSTDGVADVSVAAGNVNFGGTASTAYAAGTVLSFQVSGGSTQTYTLSSDKTGTTLAAAINSAVSDGLLSGVSASVSGSGLVLTNTSATGDVTGSLAVTTTTGGSNLYFQVGTDVSDTLDLGTYFKDVSLTNSAFGTLSADIDSAVDAADFGDLTTLIDDAIDTIAGYRSDLGAMSNRLDSNIANLQAQSENLTASMSRIMDTDYAAETAALSKNQVMQQAATAMLAQANQMPNAVLSLLK
ncbi:flagellin N-terminal helical domain-containing protein [Hydrogenophaga sp.]|uniref:flagellin N-terminal helical domain-containing protein n=1 Tax=Hydrogenophaga sp. TaxID=1904254 RepID=UPI003F6B779D